MAFNCGVMIKKSNLNKIQTIQNKILRFITNAPSYILDFNLHTDLKIKTIHEEAKTYYKQFCNKLLSHLNPLISGLATRAIPGNPPRRLKKTGREIFLMIIEKKK